MKIPDLTGNVENQCRMAASTSHVPCSHLIVPDHHHQLIFTGAHRINHVSCMSDLLYFNAQRYYRQIDPQTLLQGTPEAGSRDLLCFGLLGWFPFLCIAAAEPSMGSPCKHVDCTASPTGLIYDDKASVGCCSLYFRPFSSSLLSCLFWTI